MRNRPPLRASIAGRWTTAKRAVSERIQRNTDATADNITITEAEQSVRINGSDLTVTRSTYDVERYIDQVERLIVHDTRYRRSLRVLRPEKYTAELSAELACVGPSPAASV